MKFRERGTLKLPHGYCRNLRPDYFSDQRSMGGIWQPDVYDFAASLANRLNSSAVVDLGCGNGSKLAEMGLEGRPSRVGVDFKSNLNIAKGSHYGSSCLWFEHDLNRGLRFDRLGASRMLVVASDVIEHLTKPQALLKSLRRGVERGLIEAIVISTPDRDRARNEGDLGPPENRAHVQEWSFGEFRGLLDSQGLSPSLHGWTRNYSGTSSRNTQLAMIWPQLRELRGSKSPIVRAGAIVPMFNEADIIGSTIDSLRRQGLQVHVIDNWSNDGSYEIVQKLSADDSSVSLERFPSTGPTQFFEWERILIRIEEVADRSDWDWAIHVDADETLETPLPDLSLLESLAMADRLGYDLIDFTLIDVRPTLGESDASSMQSWEFASRSGATRIQRAWKIDGPMASIHESGGHEVSNRNRLFPLNFLLKHYPLRGTDHARRKIFEERRPRFGSERERGWHFQYDSYSPDSSFLWEKARLNQSFQSDKDLIAAYLPEVTTRAGLTFN